MEQFNTHSSKIHLNTNYFVLLGQVRELLRKCPIIVEAWCESKQNKDLRVFYRGPDSINDKLDFLAGNVARMLTLEEKYNQLHLT